ncbi:PspC domain-containing protein [Actinoallomurus bryophytorum]|nr:PspC domain-containing protein [Actinoallomurus bryophytorum]
MNEDAMNEPTDTQPHRLTRTRSGRMITGVCSGTAAYFGVDPTLVRLAAAILTVLTSGAGILLYVAAALIIPEEGKDVSIAQELINKQTHRNDSV